MNPSSTPAYHAPLYFVRSDTDPRRYYSIAQVDDRCACGQRIAGLLHCSCPDHLHRARDCKHIKAHLRGESISARPKARPTRTLAEVNADLYGVAS